MLLQMQKIKEAVGSLIVLGITPIDYDGCGEYNDDLNDILGKNNYKDWNDLTKQKLGTENAAGKIKLGANDKFIKREHSFMSRYNIKEILALSSKIYKPLTYFRSSFQRRNEIIFEEMESPRMQI
jgi:hypothetical protein